MKTEAQVMCSSSFKTFLIFSNFLRSQVLSCFVTREVFRIQSSLHEISSFPCLVANQICTKTFKNSKIQKQSCRSVFKKSILKICRKFTGEHSCRSAIAIKLLCNFIEITLRHGCSPVNLLHVFRAPFLKNTSGWLLLKIL